MYFCSIQYQTTKTTTTTTTTTINNNNNNKQTNKHKKSVFPNQTTYVCAYFEGGRPTTNQLLPLKHVNSEPPSMPWVLSHEELSDVHVHVNSNVNVNVNMQRDGGSGCNRYPDYG